MTSFPYEHPHAQTILRDCQKILEFSDTAKRLKQFLTDQPYSITVLANPVAQSLVLPPHNIYLCVPAPQNYADIEQTLDLSAALLELRFIRQDQSRPLDFPEKIESQQKQHLYNLDIILGTFPIAEELEENGYKALQSLRKNGLGKIFKGWKNMLQYEELIKAYWEMF